MQKFLHLLHYERGTTALEFAFLAPVFFAMIFGVINIAQVAWTLGSLHFAAEAAARYASINTSSDGTPPSASTVQTYALSVYHGETLSSNPFTYSATGCGNTVTASYTYTLSIPLAGTWTIPLAAAACFP
jgi:Flp pilus assembly protein TadG